MKFLIYVVIYLFVGKFPQQYGAHTAPLSDLAIVMRCKRYKDSKWWAGFLLIKCYVYKINKAISVII